eukprot:2248572-Rhodomonas_salina.3
MPTDALRTFRDVVKESEAYGIDKLKQQQQQLGSELRQVLSSLLPPSSVRSPLSALLCPLSSLLHGKYGFKSVAAPGFQVPALLALSLNFRRFESRSRVLALTPSLRAGAGAGGGGSLHQRRFFQVRRRSAPGLPSVLASEPRASLCLPVTRACLFARATSTRA